mgnify:CR=1 FL=1
MFSFINKNNHKVSFLNFLVSAIPLSFILGNTIININIALIILSSIIFFGKDIFKIESAANNTDASISGKLAYGCVNLETGKTDISKALLASDAADDTSCT